MVKLLTTEQEELSELLRQDESLQQQYDLLTRIWTEKEDNPKMIDGSLQTILFPGLSIRRAIDQSDQGEDCSPQQTPQLSRRKYGWLQPCLLIIVAGWLWISQSPELQGKKRHKEIIEARNGSRSRSVLPDGTTVWLNAGSKLYYENDFTGATREVRLEGEAFFDVVKKPDQPFIVHTSGIDIKVIGYRIQCKILSRKTKQLKQHCTVVL